jgi:hypothetical protein
MKQENRRIFQVSNNGDLLQITVLDPRWRMTFVFAVETASL